MSRDYKPRAEPTKNTNQTNPFLSGLMIGFLCGVIASLAVVMLVKGEARPFSESKELQTNKIEKNNTESPHQEAPGKDTEKTRFDFYTILPSTESKVSAEEERKMVQEAPQPQVQQDYFLQVGAFQTEEEADNMKASLALQGFEAVVQTATIPEKGVWHRVRVGPLNNLDQINKTKSDLIGHGFKADLIKVKNE